jgi:hypothetical protein
MRLNARPPVEDRCRARARFRRYQFAVARDADKRTGHWIGDAFAVSLSHRDAVRLRWRRWLDQEFLHDAADNGHPQVFRPFGGLDLRSVGRGDQDTVTHIAARDAAALPAGEDIQQPRGDAAGDRAELVLADIDHPCTAAERDAR